MNDFWKENRNTKKRKHYSAQHWLYHLKVKSGTGSGPAGRHVRIGITDYEDLAEKRASGRRAG
eukprot:8988709-Lingulodinium_polyedra.AAC.1